MSSEFVFITHYIARKKHEPFGENRKLFQSIATRVNATLLVHYNALINAL